MANKYATANVYVFEDFTGGTDDCLDYVDGNSLNDGDIGYVYKDVGNYISEVRYVLDADSGATASSPDVIAPATNAGTKRWIRCGGGIVVGDTAPTNPFTNLFWLDTSE